MSHYARLIQRIRVRAKSSGASTTLPIDTEVKNVRIVETALGATMTAYEFDAQIDGAWVTVVTHEDLPLCTDKGRSKIAESPYGAAVLNAGRPATGTAPTEVTIGIRVTKKQREYLQFRAATVDETLSEYVRRLLIQDGMKP